MTTDKHVNEIRDEKWNSHPLVMANAHVSTIPLLEAYKQIKKRARRSRASVAFWAHPLTGKSFAIDVMEELLARDYPRCAVVKYEATSKSKNRDQTIKNEQVWVPTSVGGFLDSILDATAFEAKRQRSIAGKRTQVKRTLYAMAADSGRLFFIVDEAQELIEAEFCWLKEIINFLVGRNITVTVVLFGQMELKNRCALLKDHGRSDLHARFTQCLFEFMGITKVGELGSFLKECDEHSEYPEGSGLTYTQFLWPLAFDAGFRLEKCKEHLWKAITTIAPIGRARQGIQMHWIAQAIAEFIQLTQKRDAPNFESSESLWRRAVRATDFARQDAAA